MSRHLFIRDGLPPLWCMIDHPERGKCRHCWACSEWVQGDQVNWPCKAGVEESASQVRQDGTIDVPAS